MPVTDDNRIFLYFTTDGKMLDKYVTMKNLLRIGDIKGSVSAVIKAITG